MASLHIGTSGWNYKHWREVIYPKGTPQRRWLDSYAREFDTVELNTSFYRIPTAESVEKWQATVPSRFRFALKLWRGITHYRKLKNASDLIQRFLDVAEVLESRHRGPILVQLPPNQGFDPEKLESFLMDWKSLAHGWRLAFEFRNDSWLNAETHAILTRHRAALCLHDMRGKAAVDEPNDVSFVYIRRHGSSDAGPYQGSYSPAQIHRDADRMKGWVSENRDVFVYYNNDIGGHAWYNARDLAKIPI